MEGLQSCADTGEDVGEGWGGITTPQNRSNSENNLGPREAAGEWMLDNLSPVQDNPQI